MKTCGNTGDCDRREYSCVFPADITQSGSFDPNLAAEDRVARIIDLNATLAEAKICVALVPDEPESEFDAGI